jgi:hypothetical protein
MVWFFIAMVSAACATLAGRDAVRVARLSARLGAGGALLVACWVASAFSIGIAGFIGALVGAQIGQSMAIPIAGVVLILAAISTHILRPAPVPREPTRSFGAIVLVMGTSQLAAGSSLINLAVSAISAQPGAVIAGGILGSGAVLSFACKMGQSWETTIPIVGLRWSIGALLLGVAIGLIAFALYSR